MEEGPHQSGRRTEVRTKAALVVQDITNQLAVNKTASAVALGAVCSPAWLPSFAAVSATATEWLPIVGITYLLLQAAHFLWTKRWRKPAVSSKDES